MKIAYVCNEYPPLPHGGIGTFVHTIAHGMKAAGHTVTVLGWGPAAGEWDDEGIRVVTVAAPKVPFFSWYLRRQRIARWLETQAETGELDIVEVPDFQGPLIHKLRNMPVVVRLHLTATAIFEHSGLKPNGMVSRCEQRQLLYHRHWIAVSEYSLRLTKQTFAATPDFYRVIFYPVTPSALVSHSEVKLPKRFILFAGGTVSRRKGALHLANVARNFLKKWDKVDLVFAGECAKDEGRPMQELINEAVGVENSQRVHFLGRLKREDLLSVMAKAEIFAYPSTLETFGLVLAEAMLSGCPVVAANIGPNPEFIENGVTGILVKPADHDSLNEGIQRLLLDRELSAKMAQAGRMHIFQRFSLGTCVSETIKFYESALAIQKVNSDDTSKKLARGSA